ncbi:MAG TPA: hypothetical protein VJX68_03840 [Candidatus Binatus sp.]|nr:hypothetical protein [Candidatus Binatus sp.]
MPALSRADQSRRMYAGKIANGWPLVIRNSFRLLWRFRPGRAVEIGRTFLSKGDSFQHGCD